MKIVQYMLGFRAADGGVVRALIDLCHALAAKGHEVIVLTTDASDAPRTWDGRGGRPLLLVLPVHHIGQGVLTRDALREAERVFHKADVIHLHVPWDLICIQLGRLARRMNIRYVVTVHGMLDDWTMAHGALKKKMYLALMGRRLLERAATVHCAARVEMEQSQKWFPRGRSKVIPLLFDLNEFANLPGPHMAQQQFALPHDGKPTVLYLGRLHPIKRIELLIEATNQLRRQHLEITLVIAGSGDPKYEASLRESVKHADLEAQVNFAGFVTGPMKQSLYQAADVVVMPSAHESFGYSLVEALACGTPVVTTRGVNIWPELEAGGGAMITETTPAALAKAVANLLERPEQASKSGALGRAWVFKHLEPLHVVASYEQMYRG